MKHIIIDGMPIYKEELIMHKLHKYLIITSFIKNDRKDVVLAYNYDSPTYLMIQNIDKNTDVNYDEIMIHGQHIKKKQVLFFTSDRNIEALLRTFNLKVDYVDLDLDPYSLF